MAGDLIGMGYEGNAQQGLGSNAGIAVPDPQPELKHINDTIKNVMLLDAERNTKMFSQKVKDRDSLTQQILENQVSTGEISPEDQKIFDKEKDGVEDAFKKWGGNWNDTEGYRKYQQAVTGLKDVAAHGQTRWAMIKQLEAEKAQATLPWKQKAIQDHIDRQKSKDFWNQIDPYQQAFSLDYGKLQNSIAGGGMTVEGAGGKLSGPAQGNTIDTKTITRTAKGTTEKDVSKTAPAKQVAGKAAAANMPITGKEVGPNELPPVFSVQRSSWDFDAMLKRAQLLQLQNGEDAENQNQLLHHLENYAPTGNKEFDDKEKQRFLDNINARISQYNQETGKSVAPVKMVNGKISETAPSFAAKVVLSNIEGNYTSSSYVYDENAIKLRKQAEDTALKQQALKLKSAQVGIARGALDLKRHIQAYKEQEAKGGDDANLQYYKNFTGMVNADNTIDVTQVPSGQTAIQGIVKNPKTGKPEAGELVPFMSMSGEKTEVEPHWYGDKTKKISIKLSGQDIDNRYNAEMRKRAQLKQAIIPKLEWAKEYAAEKGLKLDAKWKTDYYDDKGNKVTEDNLKSEFESDRKELAKKHPDYDFSTMDYGAWKRLQLANKKYELVIKGDDGGQATKPMIGLSETYMKNLAAPNKFKQDPYENSQDDVNLHITDTPDDPENP